MADKMAIAIAAAAVLVFLLAMAPILLMGYVFLDVEKDQKKANNPIYKEKS
jgi:hypothetical protein